MYNQVMVIDDFELDRYVTEYMVNIYEFARRVVCFSSANLALEYLHAIKNNPDDFPDVIFLDIHMPVMNGFDFLDKFMEFPEEIQKLCKIVMLSSSRDLTDMGKIKKYTLVQKFLQKPITENMLRELDSTGNDI